MYHPEQLTELMADSDFVVAALPATPATDRFIGEEAIVAMKRNAVFVNLGRGTTVDEAALTEGSTTSDVHVPSACCAFCGCEGDPDE